jgi:hypothetical protein
MSHETIQLDEAPLIEEQVEPFACGQFSLGVLLGNPLRSTALLRFGKAAVQIVEATRRVRRRRTPLPTPRP